MKLFSKVHCKAYLTKVSDGVRIQFYNPDGTFCNDNVVRDYKSKAIAYKYDTEKHKEIELADLSDFDGCNVEKLYRERIECDFDGVLVGYVRINIKGRIGTDWFEDEYHSYGHCFKEITETQKVGIVYFRNNAKRYVLPEDMEEVTDSIRDEYKNTLVLLELIQERLKREIQKVDKELMK